jgi:hypothetical protein
MFSIEVASVSVEEIILTFQCSKIEQEKLLFIIIPPKFFFCSGLTIKLKLQNGSLH